MLLAASGCDGRTTLRIARDAGAAKTDGSTVVWKGPCPEGTSLRAVPSDTPLKLDLLFMIDDSLSMKEEQANLARNFPRLIDELKKLPTGFPDLHLGVVSSDMGAGATAFGGACANYFGKGGVLQARSGCGLEEGRGRYLISQQGGTVNNFKGDIGDVFACLARLGTEGCGIEHQLQSVRMALSGFVGENAGFLRSDAHLAVVYITDEDDCSAPADTTAFATSTAGQDGSLLCSVYGHRCDGKAPPAEVFSTPLANCSAAPDGGGKLVPVQTFVDEMKRLRTQSVSVSVIGGWPADVAGASYAIGYDTPDYGGATLLASLPICESANGKANVELRMKQFVDAFGPSGKIISICQDDFSDAMAQVGELIDTTIQCQ